jgi:hypothetical protein
MKRSPGRCVTRSCSAMDDLFSLFTTRLEAMPEYATRAASVRRRGLFLLAMCGCEAGRLPEESDRAEATIEIELRDPLVVELDLLVRLSSEEETMTHAGAGIAGFQPSEPLRVSVFVDLECDEQIDTAPTIDLSDPYATGAGLTFGRVTSPNDFRCRATIAPQKPVIPPVTLALTFGASALWQGEIGDVEVALEVTEE